MSTEGNRERRVAVVIATRNRVEALRVALDHLRALPERPAIVVVDNGSSDGTASRVADEFPDVTLIAHRANLGAGARNVGARMVSSRYIAFADDDSWWAPGSLARAADVLDAHPSVALVVARVLVGTRQVIDPTCEAMARSPLPAQPGLPGPPVLGFIACGTIVRRSAFLDVGGFEMRFGIGGEERLLAIDLVDAGWQLCYVESLVAHHHPSPARDPAARRRIEVRNALWTAWLRRRPLGAMRRTADVLRAWRCDPAIRDGFAAAIRDLPRVLRERRSVSRELDRQIELIDR